MKITEFPNEILALVALCLDPSDIIRFRMSCKPFAEATEQKHLWVAMLRRVQNQFGAANGLSLDGLSSKEVERLATRPYRFAQGMLYSKRMSRKTGPCQPFAIYSLDWPQPPSETKDVLLIPGGRFVVALAREPSAILLHLWDLDLPRGRREKNLPRSSIYNPTHSVQNPAYTLYTAVKRDENGKEEIIIAIADRYCRFALSIWKVNPLDRGDPFSLLTHIAPGRNPVLSPECLALEYDTEHTNSPGIDIYNFMENTKARISFPVNFSGASVDNFRLVFFHNNYILFGWSRGVDVLDMTHMEFFSVSDPLVASNNYDQFVVKSLELDQTMTWTAAHYLSSPTTHTKIIKAMGRVSQDEYAATLLTFSTIPSAGHDTDVLKLSVIAPLALESIDTAFTRPYLISERHLLFYKGLYEHKVIGYFGKLQDNNSYSLVRRNFYEAGVSGKICPMSGRVCVYDDREFLAVLDFVDA